MITLGGIKRRFERDGYAVVPSVFSADECSALLKEVERIGSLDTADIVRVRDLSTSQRAGISIKQAGDAHYMIGELLTHGKAMASFVSDRRLVSIARAVLGGRGRSASVRYHFSHTITKPARIGPRLRWHRDFPNAFITHHRAQHCRIMVCLDGMTRRNGPTAFEPGTHRISDAAARHQSRRKQRRRPRCERLAVCPPGSVIVFHAKVRHAAGGNRSPQGRCNVIMQWGAAHAGLIATSVEQWTSATPEAIRSGARPQRHAWTPYQGPRR